MKKLNLLPHDLVEKYALRRGVKKRITNILNRELAKTKRGAKHRLIKTLLRYHNDYDLRLLSPDRICALVSEVRNIYPNIDIPSYKNLCKQLLKGFSFSSAIKWMKDYEHIAIIYSGLRFCPYCNADTVYALKLEGRHVRSDIDHFFPQDKYPFLATSLYNLIPCCSRCNSSIKYNREIAPNSISIPYANDVDDNIHFDVIVRNVGGFIGDCSIGTYEVKSFSTTSGDDAAKAISFVRFFELEELYGKSFTLEICDVMRRVRLCASHYPLFLLQKGIDVFSLLWHDIPTVSQINLYRLGKLKRDIVMQFGVQCI